MMHRASIPASTASPIVRVLNRDVGRYHRWCTPSILPERFAAAAQGADRTMFSVHGSSGSNWSVLRALALERSDALVLVPRNIHHSVINALKAFRLDFRFLPTPYEPRFEALMPPSVEQVRLGLARYPEALAVLYTSPTYEGLAAHTAAIADVAHATSEHAMVIVDEAWGGHLTSIPSCRGAQWRRAPTSACSPPTSWPAACSRPGWSTGARAARTPSVALRAVWLRGPRGARGARNRRREGRR